MQTGTILIQTELRRLEKYFEKELNDSQLDVFYQELRKFREASIRQAVDRALRERRTMPTVADLRSYIEEKAEQSRFEKLPTQVECSRCLGSGLIEIWSIDPQFSEDRGYWESAYCRPRTKPHPDAERSVSRCNCLNGARHGGLPASPASSSMVAHPGLTELEPEMTPWD